MEIIKASEHGLGLYYRPKEGRDSACDVPVWIKEGWEWILARALGLPYEDPDWFRVPVMRRIAISTPHVMAALRRLNRDQARPYNFALAGFGEPIRLAHHATGTVREGSCTLGDDALAWIIR